MLTQKVTIKGELTVVRMCFCPRCGKPADLKKGVIVESKPGTITYFIDCSFCNGLWIVIEVKEN